ncbi:MAG: YfhO family protein [bacterium]
MAKREIKHSRKVIEESKKSTKQIEMKQLKDFPIWLVSSIFLLTTIIFFWEQLIGSTFFWEDFVEQVYPIQTFAAQAFSNWEIPFWNPYTFCGMPFFADLQVGFLYPLNRLTFLFLDSSGHLSVWGLQFIIILHFFIAQLSMYHLMKYLKISSIGSIIGSISYAFSLSLVLHVIHPMMVYHLAWFPLVILFFLRGITETKIKYGIISGLIFGISMLAGHPQTILYQALFLGLLLIWYVIADIRKNGFKAKQSIKSIVAGLLPFIISVCIFSVQYLPSQDLANYSKRADATYEAATEGSLEFEQIYTSLVPKLFGFTDGADDKSVPYHLDNQPYYYYWDTAFYFGLTALLLGLIAIVGGYKNRLTAFLIFISIFGFLFALGDNFVLFKIFFNLPFFGLLRIPARIMFFAVLAFSILAGFGFDAIIKNTPLPLSRGDKTGKKFLTKIIIGSSVPLLFSILIASGTLLKALDTPEQYLSNIQSFGTIALVFILCIIVVLFLMYKGILKPIAAGVILIILTFIDLYTQGASFNSSPNNPENSYKIDKQLKDLFVAKDKNDLFRVSMRHYNPSYMAMMRNQGLIDKIMLVEGYNQLVFNHIPPPTDVKNIHDLYNVKYELSFNQDTRQFSFVERQGYFSRAWMTYNTIISTPEQIKYVMQNNSEIDYSNTVVIEEKIDLNTTGFDSSSSGKVNIINFKNNGLSCDVQTPKKGILVFSEIWYPDWAIYVDGVKSKLLKANYSFCAVEIPNGSHKVELKYESDKFTLGLYLMLASICLSVAGLILLRKE